MKLAFTPNKYSTGSVQIFSAPGELVWVKEFNTANRMDLSSLSPGIYMVNLTSENQTASQKILVRD